MLNERENILSALREKPLKAYEIMKRANIPNEEACQSLLLKMRDDGLVKFDIHKGRWLIGLTCSHNQNGAGHLFWIKSERLELPTPFGRRIAEPLDADAPGQATF